VAAQRGKGGTVVNGRADQTARSHAQIENRKG
jgi:hypothetical protein